MLTDLEVARNVSVNVRLFLAKASMNQSELSRRAGENHVTISTICCGKWAPKNTRRYVVPGVGVLSRIAAVLEVSIDQLVATPPENAEEVIERSSVRDGRGRPKTATMRATA